MNWWQTLALVLFVGPSIVWLAARAGVLSAHKRIEREERVKQPLQESWAFTDDLDVGEPDESASVN